LTWENTNLKHNSGVDQTSYDQIRTNIRDRSDARSVLVRHSGKFYTAVQLRLAATVTKYEPNDQQELLASIITNQGMLLWLEDQRMSQKRRWLHNSPSSAQLQHESHNICLKWRRLVVVCVEIENRFADMTSNIARPSRPAILPVADEGNEEGASKKTNKAA
jgi:hypothetical protein